MRKFLLLIMMITGVVIVAGCDLESSPNNDDDSAVEEGFVRLPDLDGMTLEEIDILFEDLPLSYDVMTRSFDVREQSNVFIEYGAFKEAGDTVEEGSFITIIVSATIYDPEMFFTPVDMPYDGPRLDSDFFAMPYFLDNARFEEGDPERTRYTGSGGAFEVGYDPRPYGQGGGCIDGDTSVFTYPPEIDERILARANSTRYLNMDTPETWSGGEEEWGKLSTEYVCDLLEAAESIVLQTDPGDYLLGNYERLLAWVWIQLPGDDDYQLLNYLVVRQGLAEVKYLFGAGETNVTMYDDLTYTEWMFLAESRSIDDALGMHGDKLDWYWDYDADRPHPERWD